ncbi:hypothetical protein Rsub_06725 [Raphidocelis subcapitata]|uniref:Uncharacterized protein n=1 Tax=Raphidocelis subcapitata TaxID=307507 RepID=A0A2V0P9S7_9CHLO|nr:hypothetical protein Rsub_06725 [Raphidocelis subcapitata]|eukprot:GBF94610.1 hypothetical protein Rsub_06725 [Raphidocelis subcapitata]
MRDERAALPGYGRILLPWTCGVEADQGATADLSTQAALMFKARQLGLRPQAFARPTERFEAADLDRARSGPRHPAAPAAAAALLAALALVMPPGAASQAWTFQHPSLGLWQNTANVGSPLGVNLDATFDYSGSYPFVNFFKQARPWCSAAPGVYDPYCDARTLSRDALKNVKRLASKQVARTALFSGTPSDPGLEGLLLDVAWDGSGTLTVSCPDSTTLTAGCAVVKRSDRGFSVRLASGVGRGFEQILTFEITKINASNPIRNVRATPRGGICARNPLLTVPGPSSCGAAAGGYYSFAGHWDKIIFRPEYLAGIKSYSTLRFMDWLATNNSPLRTASQRPLPDWQTWNGESGGAPLEAALALARLLGAAAWVNVPHQADNALVEAMARAVASAGLGQGAKVYVEYSNEIWNFGFDQASWIQGRGANLVTGTPKDLFLGGLRFYARRARQIHQIFVEAGAFFTFCTPQIAGGSVSLELVLAGQAANAWVLEQELAYKARGGGFALVLARGALPGKPPGEPTAIAIAPYTMDVRDAIRAHAELAASAGVKLLAYEGGQHLVHYGGGGEDERAAADAALDAANRSPGMKALYLAYLRAWRAEAGTAGGVWGSKEFESQERSQAPKFDALMTYMEENKL